MHALVARGLHDLGGRDADALVHDLHAEVARAHRDLFRAVAVAVEARLAHQQLERAAELHAYRTHPRADLLDCGVSRAQFASHHAGRCAVFAEDSAQRVGPLAGCYARLRTADARGHHVRAAFRGVAQSRERALGVGRAALVTERAQAFDRGALRRFVHLEHRTRAAHDERARLGLGVRVHPDHELLAALDRAQPPGVRFHEPLLHVGVLDRGHRAAHGQHLVEFGLRARDQLVRLRGDHRRAVEQIAVLEQVGLVGEHLLDAQRPLLIPRPRQP